MRRAVPLLLFFGFVLGLLCLFPIHTVSPKLDAAPLTASRAGRSPSPLRRRPPAAAAGRRPRGGGAEGGGL